MLRKERILYSIDLKQSEGLEIGPLTAPVVTKKEANVFYVDHMSTEELKVKYKNEPVELEQIVEVDYVAVPKKTLAEVTSKKKFDYIIASHVIEHVPDVIRWLSELYEVLKPGGILSLAIPDKRATFDINRQNSTTADLVGAYLDKLQQPTSAMMFDFATECLANVSSEDAWEGKDYSNAPRYWTIEQAKKMCSENLKPGVYVDCHCFVFTPHTFSMILIDLAKLGYLKFEVNRFLETQEGELEFYVSLKKPKTKKTTNDLVKTIPNVREKVFLKDQTVLKLENEKKQLKARLVELQNSNSWKVTKPLRTIGKVKRLKNEKTQ